MSDLDYNADKHCPVYNEVISADLCYETILTLSGDFKLTSLPELSKVNDIPKARKVCDKCPYSDLGCID